MKNEIEEAGIRSSLPTKPKIKDYSNEQDTIRATESREGPKASEETVPLIRAIHRNISWGCGAYSLPTKMGVVPMIDEYLFT